MKNHVLMCQDRFVPAIRAGTKPHTIRGQRKRAIKPGDTISLRRWTGLPYRSRQEVIKEVICTRVSAIRIYQIPLGPGVLYGEACNVVDLDGKRLTFEGAGQLAIKDGFPRREAFFRFFRDTHGLPFEGILIEWDPKL